MSKMTNDRCVIVSCGMVASVPKKQRGGKLVGISCVCRSLEKPTCKRYYLKYPMAENERIQQRIPPQNLEAEQSVLGALMIDKDAIISVADVLDPEDFYKDAHGKIYDAMLDLYERHEPIDILSLSNRLDERAALESVGGRSYLTSLANVVPTAAHIEGYAKIVKHKSTLRKLLTASQTIAELGFQESEDAENTLDKAEKALFAVSQKHLRQNFVHIKNILVDTFNRLDELHQNKGKLRGIPTGFTDLDKRLGGLQKSDLVILAARPSIGKTTLALDIARNVAVKANVPVGIFSLEMSKEQLSDRMLCAEAGVGLWKMRTGQLEQDEDFSRIGEAMGKLSEAPIYIEDSGFVNVMQIRTKARRLKMENDLGLIVVDYLQLMEGSNTENRVQEISEITRALKSIARELNIPVLALSQLSRAVEALSPPIPKLSHLRESGSIEQDADIVMFIYRPSVYRNKEEMPQEERNLAKIIIAKHRNGPTGEVDLSFDEERLRFENRAKEGFAGPEPFN